MFKKIGETSFLYRLGEEADKLIRTSIERIDGPGKYEDFFTQNLFLTLLGRYIGGRFIDSEYRTLLDENAFITIEVSINNSLETFSLGYIHINKDKKSLAVGLLHK